MGRTDAAVVIVGKRELAVPGENKPRAHGVGGTQRVGVDESNGTAAPWVIRHCPRPRYAHSVVSGVRCNAMQCDAA